MSASRSRFSEFLVAIAEFFGAAGEFIGAMREFIGVIGEFIAAKREFSGANGEFSGPLRRRVARWASFFRRKTRRSPRKTPLTARGARFLGRVEGDHLRRASLPLR
jgi:hypothetical protein